MKRLAIFLSAMVAAVLFFTSCEGNIPVKDKSLYGKWENYAEDCASIESNFEPIIFDTIVTYLTFNRDMTFSLNVNSKKITGRYWVYNNATVKVLGIDDSLIFESDLEEKYDFIKLQMPNGHIDWYCYEIGVYGDLILSCPPDYTGCTEYYRKVE